MSINQRPTCVTVIGWFWVISGGLACFGAIGAVFSFVMIGKMSQAHPEALQNMSAIFRFIPVLAPVQVGVGILGIISGINFLKRKPWARAIVEVLAWLLLLYVLLFGIWFLTQLWGEGPSGFEVVGMIMGIVIIGTFAVPLGIILKYLRGDVVKNAMISSAEQITTVDSPEHRR